MTALTFPDERLGKDCATWGNEIFRNKDMDSQKPRKDQPADMTRFSDQFKKFSQGLHARVYWAPVTISLRVCWFFQKFVPMQEQEILSHWRNILGVSIIHRNFLLYLLIDGNLPVHFPSDWGPYDLTRIKLGVHTSQDELPTILICWLAGEKRRSAWVSTTHMIRQPFPPLSASLSLSDTKEPKTRGLVLWPALQTPPGSRHKGEEPLQRNTQSFRGMEI